MADVSLVLATVATATAALVAIVGGLLVSRVVSLATERGGLQRRRDDVQARQRLEEGRLSDLERVSLEEDAEFVMWSHESELAADPPTFDLSTALSKTELQRDIEELRPLVQAETAAYADARASLDPHVGWAEQHEAFDALVERLGLRVPVGQRGRWELVYDLLTAEKTPQRERSVWEYAAHAIPGSGFQTPFVSSAATGKNLTRSRLALAALRVEAKQVQLAMDRVAEPVGLTAGLSVLGGFSVAGVLVPLVLMMLASEGDSWAAWTAIGLFTAGLIALFSYPLASSSPD